MPNILQSIEAEGFRNLERFEAELSPGLTVVTGANAAGKTNLVEAIQLVTAAESFRRPRWDELITNGLETARVRAVFVDRETPTEIEMSVSPGAGRVYAVNKKRKRGATEIIGRAPSVVFSPDDLFMVKGPAEERRRAVDEAGDQVSSGYRALRREYGRILKQRNAALKQDAGRFCLSELDSMLIGAAGRLISHRARLTRMIADKAEVHYRTLSGGEGLETSIMPSWSRYGLEGDVFDEESAAELVRQGLKRAEREELARGITLIGPHKDDITFNVGGSDSRRAASQGQQRSIALAWKFAEVDVIEGVCGKRPILLLDDVMSELDSARRAALTSLVVKGTQTVITTANMDYFDSGTPGGAVVVELGVSDG